MYVGATGDHEMQRKLHRLLVAHQIEKLRIYIIVYIHSYDSIFIYLFGFRRKTIWPP